MYLFGFFFFFFASFSLDESSGFLVEKVWSLVVAYLIFNTYCLAYKYWDMRYAASFWACMFAKQVIFAFILTIIFRTIMMPEILSI